MKESIYKQMVMDGSLSKLKRKRKKVLSERLIEDIDKDCVKTTNSNLKDFLKRNGI
jgi:hypothetical protein